MPHHFKALHTLSKLMFLGAVIYLLGGFGFFLSHLLAIQSTVTAVVWSICVHGWGMCIWGCHGLGVTRSPGTRWLPSPVWIP